MMKYGGVLGIMTRVIYAFQILFSEYVKACESFSNLIALILGYSESIGTFIMGLRGVKGTLRYDRFKMECLTLRKN